MQITQKTIWFGLCMGLTWLLGACALLSDTGEPSTATTAIPPTSLPNTQPTAVATSAPASAPNTVESVRLILAPGDNEARYRVREQLARISFPSDAVGATRAVTGTIVAKADGTIASSESQVQVDLSTLKSDEGQRDRFIKTNTLQTNRYPLAVFVPTAIQGLTLPPKPGDVAFKLIGDLTIRNVTKPVTWDVKGTVNGDEATGTATTSFTFDYFNLTKPSVMTVLSVEDTIRLEIDLHLKREVGQ